MGFLVAAVIHVETRETLGFHGVDNGRCCRLQYVLTFWQIFIHVSGYIFITTTVRV
jgi:hypothetical protein